MKRNEQTPGDKRIFVRVMNRLWHILFLAVLYSGAVHAQLLFNSKTDAAVVRKLKIGAASPASPKSCLGEGRKIAFLSDSAQIRYYDTLKSLFIPAEGILIATVKGKNNTFKVACNGGEADHPGRIYVCWDDEKFYAGDSDVFLSYSDDNGLTWTEPILVTYHPNHKAQFMPELLTDRKGTVYLLYYDRQNAADNKMTDVYLAISSNGGLKFDYYRVNTKPFKYNGNTTIKLVQAEPVIVAWIEHADEVFAAELRDSLLAAYNKKRVQQEILTKRTVLFSDTVKVEFNLKRTEKLSAIITKPLEPGFEKWIVKKRKFKKGANTLVIDTQAAKLQRGNYTLTLYYSAGNSYAWIIDEH